MGENKQGMMVVGIPSKVGGFMGQPEQMETKFEEVEFGFKGWLAKQSLPVEAAIVSATSAVKGAAIGGLIGMLTSDVSSFVSPPNATGLNLVAMASLNQALVFFDFAGGPLVQARRFAVIPGVNAGIACVMNRLRGKEDVQTSMVAAFGAGAMYTLIYGICGPNLAMKAIFSGLVFALLQGGIYQFGQKFSQPPAEDVHYVKTRTNLSNLGLENYEKNFKKGLLTDNTLPLLTDSALRDV